MTSQTALAWRGPLLLTGVGLSGVASGALASLSLVAVPTILTTTTNANLLTCWKYTLQYGIKLCLPFALASSVAHGVNAYLHRNSASNRSTFFTVAAICSAGIVPFTFAFISPTNAVLEKREKAAIGTTTGHEARSVELVKKWARVNLMRAFLPAIGAVVASYGTYVSVTGKNHSWWVPPFQYLKFRLADN